MRPSTEQLLEHKWFKAEFSIKFNIQNPIIDSYESDQDEDIDLDDLTITLMFKNNLKF